MKQAENANPFASLEKEIAALKTEAAGLGNRLTALEAKAVAPKINLPQGTELEELKQLQAIIGRHEEHAFKIRGVLYALLTALAVPLFSPGRLWLAVHSSGCR